jgi:hypothetical protein
MGTYGNLNQRIMRPIPRDSFERNRLRAQGCVLTSLGCLSCPSTAAEHLYESNGRKVPLMSDESPPAPPVSPADVVVTEEVFEPLLPQRVLGWVQDHPLLTAAMAMGLVYVAVSRPFERNPVYRKPGREIEEEIPWKEKFGVVEVIEYEPHRHTVWHLPTDEYLGEIYHEAGGGWVTQPLPWKESEVHNSRRQAALSFLG